jgi:hypothetical protein
MECGAPAYRPRDAEHTVLHQVIAEHLEPFLRAVAEAGDGAGLPQFVEREFREFLLCGVFEAGVARFLCEGCGLDHLLPFSCKGRAWCPSCGGRRMTERAAHLVDAVLPWVPVRQWVLTMPYRLRYQMAWNHGLSRAVLRVYTRALRDVYRRDARTRGIVGGQTGMVTAVQRAGGALNVNVHFHTLVLDGVFTEDSEGALAFHPAPGPSDAEVAAALATIRQRVQRLLVRHGLESADEATGPADRLVDESPVLAGIVGASVQGRVALGHRAGARVSAARRRARHAEHDVARAAARAPRWLRSARQRVGVGARSGGAGTAVQIHLASALRAGAAAAAERRAHRAGAEDGVARRYARAGVRAAGVVGASRGDDAPAGNEPADLPWSVGSACPLARARGRVRPGRARAHGAAAARGSGRGRRAVHRARLELGGVAAPGIRH